ncbi:hypothetical protein HMPREF1401_01559 [Helicobacter pylori GAM120Ai]|uniref:Uncharacterized protein n=1 Tax=Helicobacter pylori GAM120Ai TaxID=1159029 RepID=A0AAV3ID67_HELPX|nr:hypothetical protein HMPREF1401_01559 [Helicobacter pylori GAM120Ai]
MNFNHDFNTTPLPPNETKNKKSKKTMKFSQNDKKKKNALCYNTPNTFQCKCILNV